MSKERPRTARRLEERAARKLARDREHKIERLFALSPGGTADHPIEVPTTAVIEGRVEAMPCPRCGGRLRVKDHAAPASGVRRIDAACHQCGTPRTVWFRLVVDEPN